MSKPCAGNITFVPLLPKKMQCVDSSNNTGDVINRSLECHAARFDLKILAKDHRLQVEPQSFRVGSSSLNSLTLPNPFHLV